MLSSTSAKRLIAILCMLLTVPALANASSASNTIGTPLASTVSAASAPAFAAASGAGVAGSPSWGAGGLLQAAFGLIVVLALIFLCAWVARRLGMQRQGNGSLLKVVSSTMVGQRERVVIVEVAGTWVILGVTPGRINALHTMSAEATTESVVSAGSALSNKPFGSGLAASFAQKLQKSMLGQQTMNQFNTKPAENSKSD